MNNEIKRWLASDKVCEDDKNVLRAFSDEEADIAMGSFMKFGTAGLRAKMNIGTAYMNIYTVAHATAGLSKMIVELGVDAMKRGVAIAYDSRNNSELFAKRSAEVLSAYGIKVYIYPELRPTPCLSFALRELGCIAGINVTASHNPAEYNGYKVYWEDGAQLSPEHANEVSAKISETDILDGVPASSEAKHELIEVISDKVDEAYKKAVLAEQVNPDALKESPDFTVVYTPLHGAGITMVPDVLKRAGLKNLHIVSEQSTPDGNFPTVKYPNPEFEEAFTLGTALAKEVDSKLIVATDPDTDRVGVAAKDKDGNFTLITGNQMGALLLDYIITAHKENGTMPPEPYAVKSIVSTALAEKICKVNGVEMYDVLTGFKFIGEVIKNHLKERHGTFLLGFEESYGYLKGTYARDKDAVVTSMLICEMAAYYDRKGMTLCDALDGIFSKYGYYRERTANFYFDTPDGAQRMSGVMSTLRSNPPMTVAGETVTEIRDYLDSTITDVKTGKTSPTGLPSSDILYYVTDSCVTVVRPSGTEPKLKMYFMANGNSKEEAENVIETSLFEMKKNAGIQI